MSPDKSETWPLRPSHASATLTGLCLALADLIEAEGGGEISRRAYLKMHSLALMAELLSHELTHWFGSQVGEDEDLLEAIQDKWVGKRGGRGAE